MTAEGQFSKPPAPLLAVDDACVTVLAMHEKPKGELVVQTIAMPRDTNRNGDIFGGWLVSQMDFGGAILASKISRARVVTVAMEGMSFLQPVRMGDTVACYARIERIGNSSMRIPI